MSNRRFTRLTNAFSKSLASDHETTQSEMLDKQASDRAHVSRLLTKCCATTYATFHDEAWRNKVAAELNNILGRVEWTLETGGDESDIAFAEAALSLVERVAGFEEIGTK